MKTFVLKCVLLIFPVALLIIPVNYFGDAGGLFSGTEAQISKYIVEGYNVANVYNINERALQRSIIKLSQARPSILVLGSSRIMLIHSTYFRTTSFMNHGVSGASLEDMTALYWLYKKKTIVPDKIVIGIDPWIFNANNGQTRWQTLDSEYKAFLAAHGEASPRSWVHHDDTCLQLVSPSYFQVSLKMLEARIFAKDKTILIPTKVKMNDTFTVLSDGSISYDLKYRTVTVADVNKRAKDYVADTIYSLENYAQFSDRAIHLFNLLIDDMLADHVEVAFLLMPYHPLVYNHIVANDKYKIVVDFERYIREYALEKKIRMLGSFDPNRYNLDSDHFYDGMHLNEKGIDVVLAQW